MKTRRLFSLSLSLPLLALLGSGCASDTRGGEEDVESEINAIEDGHGSVGGGPPPMGPHALLFAALNEPSVSADKRAEIQAVLESARPPSTEEDRHRQRAAALAAAVRSGVVEPAKLEPSAAEVQAHEENVRTRMTSALAKLHGILDATEREAVVARVRKQKPGAGPRPPHGPPHGDHIGMLLLGISLDEAQRTKIEAALEEAGLDGSPPAPPAPPEPAVLEAFLDSFAADAFDPSGLPAPPKMPRPPVLEALAVVVPLLDSEQRDALSARILQGPPRPPPRR